MDNFLFYAVTGGITAAGLVYLWTAKVSNAPVTFFIFGGGDRKVDEVVPEDEVMDTVSATEESRRGKANAAATPPDKPVKYLYSPPKQKLPVEQKQHHFHVGQEFELP